MAANKLGTDQAPVHTGSRHDTKQSQGSRTRTAQGGFKSHMTWITSDKAHSAVGKIPFFFKKSKMERAAMSCELKQEIRACLACRCSQGYRARSTIAVGTDFKHPESQLNPPYSSFFKSISKQKTI